MIAMTERKPWWKRKRWLAAGVLWLLIIYPLGYGPACWLVWQHTHPWVRDAVGFVYLPMDLVVLNGPSWASNPLLWYMRFWYPDNSSDPFS